MDEKEGNQKRLIIVSGRKQPEAEVARGQQSALWLEEEARWKGDNNELRNKWLYREEQYNSNNCPKQTAASNFDENGSKQDVSLLACFQEEEEARNARMVCGRSNIKRKKLRPNVIRATIFLIIGYELLAELVSRQTNKAPNNQVEPAYRPCQRCLPNVVFRSCAALNTTEILPAEGNEKPSLLASTTTTGSSNATTTPTPTANKTAGETAAPNQNRNRNHNHNVLCNSHCNCVLLEPLLPELGPTGSSSVPFDEDYSLDYEETALPANETVVTRAPPSPQLPDSGQLEGEAINNAINNSGNSRSKAASTSRLQPLTGSGRDLNGPQLYAQSLYSGQAPKLALHAHTFAPSNKPAVGGGLPAAGSGPLPASGQELAWPAPPPSAGPQNYSPFPHSLRSNYFAHLRTQGANSNNNNNNNNKNNISSNVGVANNGNNQLPSRLLPKPENFANLSQRLLPLSQLDYSARLLNETIALYAASGSGNSSSINPTKSKALDNELAGEQQVQNLNWTQAPKLIDEIEAFLKKLELDEDVQSVSLSKNELRFELWSELYALLAGPLRQSIYRLDLSRNSLVKLGVTFTGYLEHHLALHNNSWPFGAGSGGQVAPSSPSWKADLSKSRLKHTLLGAGRLYSLLQARLQANLNATKPVAANNATGSGSGGRHHLLQQPMSLRALDLSHNKLKWLINDQFRTLKHLQSLRLDHNKIRYIHQHAFSGLESLRFLNLNFNRLQVIYIEQFQTNYNLLALMLRANSLAYLRGGSFSSLANLKRLDLSQNKLTIMSSNALVGLESLELLNCSSNQFVHAPSASLHPLTSVRQLDLSENLLTQLAPGTFFHLPIEELWLERNEQLVSIERGAFWDLPYLKKLYLNWNPMLMSVNSQAFVGSQSLQTIGLEGCQSLDLNTKQMLENVTLANTSRLLRLEQLQAAAAASKLTSASGGNQQQQETNQNSSSTKQVSFVQPVAHIKRFQESFLEESGYKQLGAKLNYASYLATLILLVVVLKLIFKFTASSRYLETRRRRRRVYEQSPASSSSSPATGSGASLKEPALEMCEQVIFAAQQQQPPPSDNSEQPASVIPEGGQEEACDCPDCPPQAQTGGEPAEPEAEAEQAPEPSRPPASGYQLELIQRQLLAAGLDYGHANCAHFYQSLQLADMMDFYP